MRILYLAVLCVVTLAFAIPSFAADKGLIDKGMAQFNDPGFAGGKKPCSACHPNGKGLERAGDKDRFMIMGKTQGSLEEAVNFCIVNANGGKAIREDSEQMKAMVAYIKSLGKKAAPGYGAPGYK